MKINFEDKYTIQSNEGTKPYFLRENNSSSCFVIQGKTRYKTNCIGKKSKKKGIKIKMKIT